MQDRPRRASRAKLLFFTLPIALPLALILVQELGNLLVEAYRQCLDIVVTNEIKHSRDSYKLDEGKKTVTSKSTEEGLKRLVYGAHVARWNCEMKLAQVKDVLNVEGESE